MVTAALAEPLVADEAAINAEAAAVDDVAAVAAAPTLASAADPTAAWPAYLLQFMHRFLDMREAEAQACAALAGVPRELLPLDLPAAVSEERGEFLPALPQAGATAAAAAAAAPGEQGNDDNSNKAAFRTIRLPGPEAAAELLRRSMLVRVRFRRRRRDESFFFLSVRTKRKKTFEN